MQPNDQNPVDGDVNTSPNQPEVPEPTVTTPETPPAPTEPASEATTTGAATVSSVMTPTPTAPKKSLFANKKLLAILIAAPLLLIGGSAAAYFGVVVPNKPENILKSAFFNTAREKQATVEGTFDIQAADSSKPDAMPASNATFKIAANDDAKTAQIEATVTISGIKVQGELRYVGEAIYIKLGDLSTVKALAASYNPAIGPTIDKLQNQWIEIDKTLLTQAKADCAIDASMTSITEDDMNLLADAYEKNKFATIQSTSNDTVNGKGAKKFEIVIDEKKAEEYGKNFENLSFVKKLKECETTKSTAESLTKQDSKVKDGDKAQFSLWVDKSSKRIVKLEFKSDEKSEKEDNTKGVFSMTIGYGAVNVEKPSGAKSFMSLVTEFAPLFSGSQGVLGANTESDLPFNFGQ